MTELKDPIPSPQDRMMAEVVQSAGDAESIDFSAKTILARGCDPQHANSRRPSTHKGLGFGGISSLGSTIRRGADPDCGDHR